MHLRGLIQLKGTLCGVGPRNFTTLTLKMIRRQLAMFQRTVIAKTEIALLEATIANYTSRLDSSSGLSFTERSIALRFLTHFLGDITQPLHVCGREIGGNGHHVIFDGRQSENLHGIWDSDMWLKSDACLPPIDNNSKIELKHLFPLPTPQVRKRLDDFSGSIDAAIEAYAANLTSAIMSGDYKDISSGWVSCIGGLKATTQCPLQWAADSNALNCKIVWSYVLDNPGTDLDGEYYDSVVPYIDLQLAKGGYMLGTLLNSLLSGTGSVVLQD
ncbi:1795_t:CDS:2 [Paraglomus brasilianum]|uniref:1795_t:CDS:1 n=1 Tax=Paraglomus brasilianum TaxID=144538 RepID=A0A9N9CU56_9GLOM|nr:1795_t:CDS:2 [Paraglomus brasilianum]